MPRTVGPTPGADSGATVARAQGLTLVPLRVRDRMVGMLALESRVGTPPGCNGS